MPKMKTHKGISKRIKVTKGKKPKVLRRQKVVGKAVKSRKARRRQTRKLVTLNKDNRKVLKRLVPGL